MKTNELELYKSTLANHGFKATNQRIEILHVLHSNHKPMILKDIVKKMKVASAHEVTLYRILSTFAEAGLVRQLDLGANVPYFEISDNEHDHHHIVCTNCKKMSDFVGCEVDKLIKKALSQTKDFHSVNKHSFELFGLCKKCAK
jgi:Fur family ferric uptake transcriptional regulator